MTEQRNLRVLLGTTRRSTVALEVFDHSARVFTNVTEVYSLTTLAEEQETIEDLEEFRRRLVDGAENGETLVSKAAQERHDGPGRLRVKTGCGLVQEEQEFGLSGEFDTDGCPLAVLDAQ